MLVHQHKWLVGRLRLKEFDPLIDNQFGLVASGSIGLFLEIRITRDTFKDIKMRGSLKTFGHFGVPFPDKASAVAGFFQVVGKEQLDRLGPGSIRLIGSAETTRGETSQNRGSAHPANRVADKHVVESDAIGRQGVDGGRLDDLVSGASQGVVPLIVGEKEHNVGPGVNSCLRCDRSIVGLFG